ncbi:hypothetical protein [Paenibacillus sacheonensis]|uniref:Lipoprotein n=1 Tax=Paenibacillus sacheonensis TaxID=742054 RepID=A0A7X5BZ52_9BACL|nr:hypothetical protein [Paenibacillus sacheonensis]MBM7568491.1 hypothetical protein [Paenibacillus sacheonensis]NBC72318.1 hypothetical protein [Paenibacillus sacheonensis]
MNTRKMKSAILASAAAVLLLAGCGEQASNTRPVQPGTGNSQTNEPAKEPAGSTSNGGGVVLPKIELPRQSNAAADMIGLFVYQGRIYTQTDTKLAAKDAKALLGEKVGRTIGSIDEWSSQDAYATELASSIGEADIYAVKGYDPAFRLMSYAEQDGEVWTELYECLNGFTVNSGADLFGRLRLEGNLQSAQWETFNSWNESKRHLQPVAQGDAFAAFLDALNEAKPVAFDILYKQGIYDNPDQKFISLTLKDGSVTRLRLFGNGYAKYAGAAVFFRVEDAAFQALWQAMA